MREKTVFEDFGDCRQQGNRSMYNRWTHYVYTRLWQNTDMPDFPCIGEMPRPHNNIKQAGPGHNGALRYLSQSYVGDLIWIRCFPYFDYRYLEAYLIWRDDDWVLLYCYGILEVVSQLSMYSTSL